MSDGQKAGAVIGATIGFFVGGPVGALKGAYWGYTAGTLVDPPPGPNTYGPRLNDRAVQVSEDGAPLPTVFGTVRISGNVIWSSGLEEVATEADAGAGSGGGGATQTTYSYYTDAAIALCAGEIGGVRRIWADTKLIYDAGESADYATLAASHARSDSLRVYTGAEDQAADPLIQAVEGADSTPAYRGIAYVVFENFALADFGNRLPNFSFEVVKTLEPVAGAIDSISFTTGFEYLGVQSNAFHFSDHLLSVAVPLKDLRFSPTDAMKIVQYQCSDLGLTPYPEVPLLDISNGGFGVNSHISRRRDLLFAQRASGRLATANPIYSNNTGIIPGSTVNFGALDAVGNYYYTINNSGFMLMQMRSVEDNLPLQVSYTAPFTINSFFGCAASANYVYFGVRRSSDSAWCILKYSQAGTYIGVHVDSAITAFQVTAEDRLIYTKTNNLYTSSDFFATETLFCAIGGFATPSRGQYNWTAFEVHENLLIIGSAQVAGYNIGIFSNGRIARSSDPLDDVCAAITESAGLTASEYNYSALSAASVRGYTLAQPMAMRAALEPLQLAYAWDLSETDGRLNAVTRGGSLAATLTETDLGAAETPTAATLHLTRNNESELPSEIQVSYSDWDNDYHAGTQYARSLTASHTQLQQISLPLVMTSTEAARLADVLLSVARYAGAHGLAWECGYKHARLSPGDVVSLTGHGQTWRARIEQVDLGQPGLVKMQGVPDLPALYSSEAASADATGIGQVLSLSGNTALHLLDCCMLRDTDTGLGWYVAMSSWATGWRGGILFKSADAGATWTQAASATRTQAAGYGTASTALPDADCRVWDKTNLLTITLIRGNPASATETAVLDGANGVLIGAHGRWELIQYKNATNHGNGTWTLDTLLRGRRGTEWAASQHAAGDSVILLSADTLNQCEMAASELDAERLYRAITAGQALESVDAEAHTYTGERLKPLAPGNFQVIGQSNGDQLLRWSRRNRIAAAWNNLSGLANSEASESYEIDVTIDGSVVRTLTASSESVTYTVDQQRTDLAGEISAAARLSLYQISAVTGRGHAAGQTASLSISADTGLSGSSSADRFTFSAQSTAWNGTNLLAASQLGTGAWWVSATGASWSTAATATSGPGETIINGSTTVSAYIPYINVSTSASLASWTARQVSGWGSWGAADDRIYAGLWDGSNYIFFHAGWNVLSADTITWSQESNNLPAPSVDGANLVLKRVIKYGSTYVAIGFIPDIGGYVDFRNPKAYIYTSTNRTTWTLRHTGANFTDLFDIWSDGTTLVAVGAKRSAYNSQSSPYVMRSTNATSWSEISVATAALNNLNLYGIAELSSGRLLAVGQSSWYSDNDGLTWTAAGAPQTLGRPVGSGVFLVISSLDDSALHSTTNGTTWTQIL